MSMMSPLLQLFQGLGMGGGAQTSFGPGAMNGAPAQNFLPQGGAQGAPILGGAQPNSPPQTGFGPGMPGAGGAGPQTGFGPGTMGGGMNPILAQLFGGLGSNQQFYGNHNGLPSSGGLGALLPLLQHILGGMNGSQQRQTQPVARQAPQPQAPGGGMGMPGGPHRIGPIFGGMGAREQMM